MAKKTFMETIETFIMGNAAPHGQKAKSKKVKKKVVKKITAKSIKKAGARKTKTTKKRR